MMNGMNKGGMYGQPMMGGMGFNNGMMMPQNNMMMNGMMGNNNNGMMMPQNNMMMNNMMNKNNTFMPNMGF